MESILALLFFMTSTPSDTLKHSEYIFQFVEGRDMFYSPYKNNRLTIEQMLNHYSQVDSLFKDGKALIRVASYGTEARNNQSPRALAHIQRNRVKSELITRAGANEDMFKTYKYNPEPSPGLGLKNVVIVSFPHFIEVESKPTTAAVASRPEIQIVESPLDAVKHNKSVVSISDSIIVQQPQRRDKFYGSTGVGVAFGRSTLASITESKFRVGLLLHQSFGVELNDIFSLEAVVRYEYLKLGVRGCCECLYYADNERYFAPVAGVKSYSYTSLLSAINLYEAGVMCGINTVPLWCSKSKWRMVVAPYLGVAFSNTKLKSNSERLDSGDSTHLAFGGVLSASYRVGRGVSLRFSTGFTHLTGDKIDIMPPTEHRSNHILNTSLSIIYYL